jgi:hypothetical protein
VAGRVVLTGPPAPRPRTRPLTDLGSPITRLGRRLQFLTPDDPSFRAITDLADEETVDAGWVPMSGVVNAMVACAGEHLSVSPAVAGARMVGSLGYAVVGRLAVALAITGQVYDAGPDSLMVRLDGSGLVERIGVRNPALAVLATDPLVRQPGVTVTAHADSAALAVRAADRAWATLDPLIDELHEVTRYGRLPMWNLVADAVLGPATTAPGLAGLDQRAGRAIGTAVLDALVRRGAPIHRRGTLREGPQHRSGPDELVPVRGSCCLYFRVSQEKCDSCPLLSSSSLGLGL